MLVSGIFKATYRQILKPQWWCQLLRQKSTSELIYLGEYSADHYSARIRKAQNGKWAHKHVHQGIKHFKANNTVEAFQCLNQALTIDPINVEGLVARGNHEWGYKLSFGFLYLSIAQYLSTGCPKAPCKDFCKKKPFTNFFLCLTQSTDQHTLKMHDIKNER